MMSKLFLIFLSAIAVFISINSFLFLPVAAFLVATLVTNTNEFSLVRHKKILFYFLGLIIILSLISISKFI